MSKMISIPVTMEIDIDEVWSSFWCSDGAGVSYWASKIRKPDGEGISMWVEKNGELAPNPQDFKVYDMEQQNWHTVTLQQLALGYATAKAKGATHCGGCSLDDSDACVEDIILQYAIFGEMIYG